MLKQPEESKKGNGVTLHVKTLMKLCYKTHRTYWRLIDRLIDCCCFVVFFSDRKRHFSSQLERDIKRERERALTLLLFNPQNVRIADELFYYILHWNTWKQHLLTMLLLLMMMIMMITTIMMMKQCWCWWIVLLYLFKRK